MLIPDHVVDGLLKQSFFFHAAVNKVHGFNDADNSIETYYSEEQVAYIKGCLASLFNSVTEGKRPVAPGKQQFISTAGAPGSGKSVLLEHELANNPTYKNFVYLDPDEVAIKMIGRYNDMVARYADKRDGLHMAYTVWRNASNYLHNSLMNMVAKQGYNIALGTTATGGAMSKLYEGLKAQNFTIKTLVLAADDQTRADSLIQRFNVEQTRYLPADHAVDKADAFIEKFPLYFKESDEVELFWRSGANESAVKAASYSQKDNQAVVNKHEALDAFDAYMRENNPQFDLAANVSALMMK